MVASEGIGTLASCDRSYLSSPWFRIRYTMSAHSIGLCLVLILAAFSGPMGVDSTRAGNSAMPDIDSDGNSTLGAANGDIPGERNLDITQYDWPTLQHDVNHTGYSPSPAPDNPYVVWTYQAVGNILAPPAVAYGMVFFSSGWNGPFTFQAIDEATGAHIWDFPTSHYIESTPAVTEGMVFAGDVGGTLYAWDAFNGTLKWIFNKPLPPRVTIHYSSSPTVDVSSSLLFIGATLDNHSSDEEFQEILCLDMYTGNLIWNHTEAYGGGYFTSPVFTETAVFGALGEKIYSFDKWNGTILWEYFTPKHYTRMAPTLANNTVFFSDYSGEYLRALHPSNGSLKWEFADPDYYSYSDSAYHDGLLFVGRSGYNVTAFDAGSGDIDWNYRLDEGWASSPIIADGKVFVSCWDSHLYALDEKSGGLIWRFHVGEWPFGGPSIANRKIFVGNRYGTLYALGITLPPPSNLTTTVSDDTHVRLDWETPNAQALDHYLIFKSPSRKGFDFSTPVYNTSADPYPLRTNWTDMNVATFNGEISYVVRAVNEYGDVSITSNTASKWTTTFAAGMTAFSFPLEPFDSVNVSWFVDNIPNVTYIRWMDSPGHWITHQKGMGVGINDVPVEMGVGYELSLSSQTRFTFCGYPGAMIWFREGLGDSVDFRTSLTATKDGENVVLSWSSVVEAAEYRVYRSARRVGLHSYPLLPIATLPSSKTTTTDIGVLSTEGEHYYLVMPVNVNGLLGSSTYSVGVVTVEYHSGSNTFGLPLMADDVRSLDWYCDEIPNVVGMSDLISGEWKYHSKAMPEEVYDVEVQQAEGYQISIDDGPTGFTFIGH